MTVAVAVLVVIGAPWAHRAVLLGALLWPIPTALFLLGVAARSNLVEARSAPIDPGVAAVMAVAAELRSGSPLRSVLASGVLGPPVASAAATGRSFTEVHGSAYERFGAHARTVAATLELAVRDGGPAAEMFESLAAVMLDAERTRRERRAAMAPAVLQALVVGGIPVILLAQMALSGRLLASLSAGGGLAIVTIAGIGATITGFLAIAVMASRGAR